MSWMKIKSFSHPDNQLGRTVTATYRVTPLTGDWIDVDQALSEVDDCHDVPRQDMGGQYWEYKVPADKFGDFMFWLGVAYGTLFAAGEPDPFTTVLIP